MWGPRTLNADDDDDDDTYKYTYIQNLLTYKTNIQREK